jgi:hypothetical protein
MMEQSFHKKSWRATLINTTSKIIYLHTLHFNVNPLSTHKLVCKKTSLVPRLMRHRCTHAINTHSRYTESISFRARVLNIIIRPCLRVYIGEGYSTRWIGLALGESKDFVKCHVVDYQRHGYPFQSLPCDPNFVFQTKKR